MENTKILRHIENIEQDFRMLDNIFKCMNVYWKGEGATAVIDTYRELDKDIDAIRRNMMCLKKYILNENGEV